MGKVTESIFDGKTHIIPMADVQHIEKFEKGYEVITKHTKWNDGYDRDCWENPITLDLEEGKEFLKAWCHYRHELDMKGGE